MGNEEIRVIIAEDDSIQAELLKRYAARMGLTVVSCVSSGNRLIEETVSLQPDLLLMDIGLRKLDGISAYKCICEAGYTPFLILISGSTQTEHLLAGFECRSIDYLVKPVDWVRFEKSIERAKIMIHYKRMKVAAPQSTHWIKLKQKYRALTVAEDQIVYVEKSKSFRNKSVVCLADGKVEETNTSLKEIMDQCTDSLVMPHRSYLVNVKFIASVEADASIPGNYLATLHRGDKKIPVSRRSYHDLQAKLR